MVDLVAKINGGGLPGGEEVTAAAVVFPPGSTLYKSYAGKGGLVGGPIGQALGSKMAQAAEGAAGKVPRQMSALAVTRHRVLFVKVSRLGSPKEILAEWPRDQVTIEFDDGGKGYPSVELRFADGTSSRVYSSDKKGLPKLAD